MTFVSLVVFCLKFSVLHAGHTSNTCFQYFNSLNTNKEWTQILDFIINADETGRGGGAVKLPCPGDPKGTQGPIVLYIFLSFLVVSAVISLVSQFGDPEFCPRV